MDNYNNAQYGNAIDTLALFIGLQNLMENRQQSAQNDVQAANDKQAEYLLAEIKKLTDAQNERVLGVIDDTGEIMVRMNGVESQLNDIIEKINGVNTRMEWVEIELKRREGALEREVPKWHKNAVYDFDDGIILRAECPRCNYPMPKSADGRSVEHYDYCPQCGQRIEWD